MLNHRAINIPTSTKAKKKEDGHLKTALEACGYPEWAFNKCPNPAGQWNSLRPRACERSLSFLTWWVCLKSSKGFLVNTTYPCTTNTLTQRLIHPKDRTPKHSRSNTVYVVLCKGKCLELYIGETKQPLNRRMAQHRKGNGSGPTISSVPSIERQRTLI